MRLQPSGTVTFVFTDVEGSTRTLERLGRAEYLKLLADQRDRVRAAFNAFDGYEVDSAGDSFFYAFQSATKAVAAVRAALSSLAGGPLRIRVGIHTGEPALDPPKYVGIDVHRAARIMASAHGGQVLLSAATRDLLGGHDDLRDLGEHWLKDLSDPVRLFQLGEGEFPPPRSLYRTNLPTPATAFVGRERELADVTDILAARRVRLLTLTGPGGIGKTRVALEAAAAARAQFPDGVWWLPLAPLREPGLVLSAVAQMLEVKERPSQELSQTLAEMLTDKQMLLVLDNAEHLLPQAAEAVAQLRNIRNGPALLVTSREQMHIEGEQLYPIPPLDDSDAVAVFAARAGQIDPHFSPSPAVGVLCERLDNLPLAIELAAARTSVFTAEQLLERLGRRLDLLKGVHQDDPRHRTLRSTLEWSYELLKAEEQRVFRALAVFAGGCTIEAAEGICETDVEMLQSLLEKSLLRTRDTANGRRLWMLESIREYAADVLADAAETALVEQRHARWFSDFVERADAEQRSLLLDPVVERLAAEENNIRAAITWAIREEHSDELARLASSVGLTWVWRGELREVRGWLELACERTTGDSALRARVLMVTGFVYAMQGDQLAATAPLEEALRMSRTLGDVEGVAFSLNSLGIAAQGRRDREQARKMWEECKRLALEHGLEDRLAIATLNLSGLALTENRPDEAHVLAAQAAEIFARTQSPLWCNTLLLLGEAARLSGRDADAEGHLRKCLDACVRRRGRATGGAALRSLAALCLAHGEDRRAAVLLGAAGAVLGDAGMSSRVDDVEELEPNVLGEIPRPDLEELIDEGRSMSFEDAARYVLDTPGLFIASASEERG